MAARYSVSRSLWPASRACRSCSLALLAICFACSSFIFSILLFRGVLAPFTHSRGSKDAKQEDRNGGTGASRSQRAARMSDARFLAARSVLVETGEEQSKSREAQISARVGRGIRQRDGVLDEYGIRPRGGNILELRSGQLERLQVRPHDVRDSADLGSGPKLVHRCFLEAPALSECLERHIRSDLVAELEAVGHCFCRCINLEGRAANGIFLHFEAKCWARHAHEANRWRCYAWSPGFHGDGHPNLVRGLRCELMELHCG